MRKFQLAYENNSDEGIEDPVAKADLALARRIGEVLQFHYPGHAFMVQVMHGQGIATINIPILMGQWQHVIKLYDLKSDPGMKSVVRAAGEILERYKMPRQGFSMAEWGDALAAKPIGKIHVPG